MTKAVEVGGGGGADAVDAAEWLPSDPGMRAIYQGFMEAFDRRDALRTAARRFVSEWTTDSRDVEAQIDTILAGDHDEPQRALEGVGQGVQFAGCRARAGA